MHLELSAMPRYVCKYAPARTTLRAESLRTNKLLAHKIKGTHIFLLIGMSADVMLFDSGSRVHTHTVRDV